MKKSILKTTQCGLLAVASVALTGCSLLSGATKEQGKPQSFAIISSDTYQSFVKNWDEKKQPVFCALISSVKDWRLWFVPAATARSNPSFSPSSDYFADHQVLLVSRVVPAPNSNEFGKVIKADKVTLKDGTWRLYYQLNPPTSGATYQVKEFLLIGIDKNSAAKGSAQFFENGEQVCQTPE